MRIGAVNYLNSKPLVYGLRRRAPDAELRFDLPSRLADSLAAGELDVALIPTVELFRAPGYVVVSDACVACAGPVLSVKLHFRVPPAAVRTLALDEGSRTSAALSRILLAELHGCSPVLEALPIGNGLDSTTTDAVLLIGDRAIQTARDAFCEVWDLGEVWRNWTGLPFVFAMWIARGDVETGSLSEILSSTRDDGERHLDTIAAAAAEELNIPRELALGYLRDNLNFRLGPQEQAGLAKFLELCVTHAFAPDGDLQRFFVPKVEGDHACHSPG